MSFPFPWQFGLPENNGEIELDADNKKYVCLIKAIQRFNFGINSHTSSWFALSGLFSSTIHSLVIRENANTFIPQWQATSTSGIVLMPIM